MDAHKLDFAQINIVRDDIAEVIINEGVEMTTLMVEQYHAFLLSHLKAPFSLLINKMNSYTYDFEAQKLLATLGEINAMAVVVYNHVSEVSTGSLAAFPRTTRWNIHIFYNKEEALDWLYQQQSDIIKQQQK